MKKFPLILTNLMIALIAFLQLARFFLNIPITVGSILLPGWTGAVAFLVLGLLVAWSFRALADLGSSKHPLDH